MDKLKMQTANKADENFKKLAAMFPNAVTEAITGYDANGKAIVDRAIPIMQYHYSCVFDIVPKIVLFHPAKGA